MGRVVVGLVVAAFLVLAAAGSALAAEPESPEDRVDRALEQCMRQREGEFGLPTCTVDANGNLMSRRFDDDMGSAGGALGGFLVFGLLWTAIPLAIAASMASSRGESVGIAVLLTLFLGWIGLAIVYFGQERTRAAAGRALDPPAPTAPTGDDVQTRLRRLDDLRTQGLISEAERAQRRQAILDQI